MNRVYNKYVGPSAMCQGGGHSGSCDQVAVYTPEQLWPVTGLFDMSFDRSRALGVQYLDGCLQGSACKSTQDPWNVTDPSATFPDSVFTILGYSQSSAIASVEKANLINGGWDELDPRVGFVMLARCLT